MHTEKKIGFWAPPDEYPNVLTETNNPWGKNNPLQLGAVVWHLEHGIVVARYSGMSKCLICEKPLGNVDMSDQVYCWPQGYEHYLMEHEVKPPDDFIAHIELLNEISPQLGKDSFPQTKPNIVLEEWDKRLSEFTSLFQAFCVENYRSRCELEETRLALIRGLGTLVDLKFMRQAAMEAEIKRMAMNPIPQILTMDPSKTATVEELEAITAFFKKE